MKELTLKGFELIKENLYFGVMTFKQYLDLIKDGIIKIPENIDGYHRAKATATVYNKNKDLKSINGYNVDLFVINNNHSYIRLENNNLIINADSIDLLDGIFRTLIISNLDERFMNSYLNVRIHTGTIDDAQRIVMALNNQTGIGLDR
jgi:hypothetical protein